MAIIYFTNIAFSRASKQILTPAEYKTFRTSYVLLVGQSSILRGGGLQVTGVGGSCR